MRRALVLFLLLALPAAAATRDQLTAGITKFCRGAFLESLDSDEEQSTVRDAKGNTVALEESRGFPNFARAAGELMPHLKTSYLQTSRRRVFIALVANQEINAWTFINWATKPTDGNTVSLVCIPTSYVMFMSNEDELAFSIAHELGHAVDPDPGCRAYETLPRESKVLCEIRADTIGYGLMRQAGFSPYAAAGAFGRIEMYSGDTATGLTGLFRQLSIDHPITPKRIENMRRLLIQEGNTSR
jgi:hypothetical protein